MPHPHQLGTDTNHSHARRKKHAPITAADTNKKYEVRLFWTQHNMATVIIQAKSLAEAGKKADAILSEEVDDWNPVDGEIWVESVEPVEGGRGNE